MKRIVLFTFFISLIMSFVSCGSGKKVDTWLDNMEVAIEKANKLTSDYKAGKISDDRFMSEWNRLKSDMQKYTESVGDLYDKNLNEKQLERLADIVSKMSQLEYY